MITALAAALLWIGAGTRLWRWRPEGETSFVGAGLIFASLAMHLTLNTAAVDQLIDRAAGNASILVLFTTKLACICVASWGSLLLITDPDLSTSLHRSAGVHLTAIAVTLMLSTTLFLSAGEIPNTDAKTWDAVYLLEPGFAGAGVVGMIYPGAMTAAVAWASLREVRARTAMSWGLALIGLGAATFTAYAFLRIAHIMIGRYSLITPAPNLLPLTGILAVLGGLLAIIGCTYISVYKWRVGRATLLEVASLNKTLLDKFPGNRRPSSRGTAVSRQARHRVTEIVDSLSTYGNDAGLPDAGPVLSSEQAAQAISDWVISGEASPELSLASLAGARDPAWVRTIARTFDATVEQNRPVQ